jgi:hypothetical protein
MQTCAVTRAEIDDSKPLVFWNASALHIAFYPSFQEAKFQANRLNGKKGGRPKGLTDEKPHGKPKENHMVQFGVNVKEEEEEEKRKRKEKELITVDSFEPTKKKKNAFEVPTLEMCMEYGKSVSMTDEQVNGFFDSKMANGWMVGKNKMKCFKSAMRYWKSQAPSFRQSSFATQKPSTHFEQPNYLDLLKAKQEGSIQ